MRLYKVHGGVHMAHHKDGAASPLEVLAPPSTLNVTLLQHRGAPAKPVVKRGDQVLMGQIIAEAAGLGAPIHSPVSGKVSAVNLQLHPTGTMIETVVIENDGLDTPAEFPAGIPDPTKVDPEVIRKRVQESGVVGMGGAMFPTAIKLNPTEPVDTVIINGCECEPYLTCDHRIMLEYAPEIAYGWEAIRHAVGAERVIVAVEDNKPDAIAKMREYAAKSSNVEVAVVPALFPQGYEGILVKRVTGRKLRARGIPFEVGCVVQNVATAVAITHALRDGKPLTERAITVGGGAVEKSANLWVRIGTPISYILHHLGLKDDVRQVIFGGPMMGQPATSLDISIIKGSNALLAFTEAEIPRYTDGICVRCGRCVDGCPESLAPYHLARLAEQGRWEEADAAGSMLCCECGTCTYICPGERPLVQWIRIAKAEHLKTQAKARLREQEALAGGAAR
ncbi:MAG: electron transport complex subunit RsxC [Limnochordia bacterium]|jgi:electron transport complex protein RnfC